MKAQNIKTVKYNNGTFNTKDGKHRKFFVHVNEKEDKSVILSGHVNGVTILLGVRSDDVSAASYVEFVVIDTTTGNTGTDNFRVPETIIAKEELVGELVHVIGHTLSTSGWYTIEAKHDEMIKTLCLHTDALLGSLGLQTCLFTDYLNK